MFGCVTDDTPPPDLLSGAATAPPRDLFHPGLEATAGHEALPGVLGQEEANREGLPVDDEPTEVLPAVDRLIGTYNPLMVDRGEVDRVEVQGYLARLLDSLKGL